MQGGKLYIVNGETLTKIPVQLQVINKEEGAILKEIIKMKYIN